jgi:hypothetical protein
MPVYSQAATTPHPEEGAAKKEAIQMAGKILSVHPLFPLKTIAQSFRFGKPRRERA